MSAAAPGSGLLIVDKPQGVTSHDVVAAVRGVFHMKRVGHAGTLDPMATGVLVVGFGNATRLLNVIVDHDKTYEATIRLGQRTTTDDADGEPLPAGAADEPGPRIAAITPERIESTIAERFTGAIEQVPNAYSAIKINGRRAYDLAREGEQVALKARPVNIDEFAVLGVRAGEACAATPGLPLGERRDDGPMTPVIDVDVRVSCSAGTYIRALARDLGEALGVGGHLTRLRRTRVGGYRIDDPRVVAAHAEQRTFTNREGGTVVRNRAVLDGTPERLAASALSLVEAARAAMPCVAVDAVQARDLRFGRRIALDPAAVVPPGTGDPTAGDAPAAGAPMPRTAPDSRDMARAAAGGERPRIAAYVPDADDLVAVVEPCGRGMAKPVTVFPA